MKYSLSTSLILLLISQCDLVRANADFWVDTNSTQDIATISSQPFSIIILIALSLSVVLFIMLFSIFGSNNKKKGMLKNSLNQDGKSNFSILDSCQIDNGQMLYLIQFLDRKFLIASTLTNINLLAEINSELPSSKNNSIQRNTNLDFMTVQSDFHQELNNLQKEEKARAKGFMSLLKKDENIVEESLENELEIESNDILPSINDEVQTVRNTPQNSVKLQSFFSNKVNNKTIEEAPQKTENALVPTQVTKKPSWLQDKKNVANKNNIKTLTNTEIKTSNTNNTEKTNSAEKIAKTTQLISNINSQKSSIETIMPSKQNTNNTNNINPTPNAKKVSSPSNQAIPAQVKKISIVEE